MSTALFLDYRFLQPELLLSFIRDIPCPLYLSLSTGPFNQNCFYPLCWTFHVHCTFLKYRFIQPEPILSFIPDIPCPVYLSLSTGPFNQNCSYRLCLTYHVHCTFPRLQVSLTRTAPILYTWHTMSTVPFLKYRSIQPELLLSFMPDIPCPLHFP